MRKFSFSIRGVLVGTAAFILAVLFWSVLAVVFILIVSESWTDDDSTGTARTPPRENTTERYLYLFTEGVSCLGALTGLCVVVVAIFAAAGHGLGVLLPLVRYGIYGYFSELVALGALVCAHDLFGIEQKARGAHACEVAIEVGQYALWPLTALFRVTMLVGDGEEWRYRHLLWHYLSLVGLAFAIFLPPMFFGGSGYWTAAGAGLYVAGGVCLNQLWNEEGAIHWELNRPLPRWS